MSTDPSPAARLVLVNTALVVVSSVLVGWLLLRPGPGSPPTVPDPVVTPTDVQAEKALPERVVVPERVLAPPPAGVAAKGPSAQELADYLDSVLEPLAQGLKGRGADTDELLPQEALVLSCKQAADLASAPCSQVLAKLQAGFELQGMPFPAPPGQATGADRDKVTTTPVSAPPPPPQGTPPASDAAAPAAAAGAGTVAPTADPAPSLSPDQEAVRQWLDLTVMKLARAAQEAGRPEQGQPPDPAAIEAAVTSGSFGSPASQAVLDDLRRGHEQLGIPFVPPAP